MATLPQVIDYIQAKMRALDGVEEAPDEAPEQMLQFPFVMTLPRSGRITKESPQMMGLYTIYVEVHVGRQVLPKAIEMALPFGDSVPQALWADPKLGGLVSTIQEIRFVFGRVTWGNEDHIGYRFEVDFKLMTNVS
jgi:hypothetical protein